MRELDDLSAFAHADAPIYGELGVLAQDDEGRRVQCHACGQWHGDLSPHLKSRHGMGMDQYRERFGLDAATPLMDRSLFEARRVTLQSRRVRAVKRSYEQLPTPEDWDGPVYGELGELAFDGERVQCHICGEWWHGLATHALMGHGVTAQEYRAHFGLNMTTPLVGEWLQGVFREKLGPMIKQHAERGRQIGMSVITPEQRGEMLRGRRARLQKRLRMRQALASEIAARELEEAFATGERKRPEPGDWQGPVHGEIGVLATDEGRVQCHICGGWYVQLTAHTRVIHRIQASEYRGYFGLDLDVPLVGEELHNQMIASAGVSTPRRRAHWQRLRDPEHRARMSRIARQRTHSKGERVDRKCEVCGRQFSVIRSEVQRGHGKVCSRACRAKGDAERMRQRQALHGPELQAARRATMLRRARERVIDDLQAPGALDGVSAEDRELLAYLYGLGDNEPHTVPEAARHFCLREVTIHYRRNRSLWQVMRERSPFPPSHKVGEPRPLPPEELRARLDKAREKRRQLLLDPEYKAEYTRKRIEQAGARVEVSCKICGKKYDVPRHKVRQSQGTTCSQECHRKLQSMVMKQVLERNQDAMVAKARVSLIRTRRGRVKELLAGLAPDALGEIAEEDRQLLTLLYASTENLLTVAEVAHQLGISQQQVQKRRREALYQLLGDESPYGRPQRKERDVEAQRAGLRKGRERFSQLMRDPEYKAERSRKMAEVARARGARLDVTCKVCGVQYSVRRCDLNQGLGSNCGREECHREWLRRVARERVMNRNRRPMLEKLSKLAPQAFDALSERDRQVLTFLYGLEGAEGHTLDQTAERFGVSAVTINKWRNRSLARLFGTEHS